MGGGWRGGGGGGGLQGALTEVLARPDHLLEAPLERLGVLARDLEAVLEIVEQVDPHYQAHSSMTIQCISPQAPTVGHL
jgi:hypothetical protein